MPLPSNPAMAWPPPTREQAKYDEWSAWYSGDPERLANVYAGPLRAQGDTSSRPNVPWWRFWSRQNRGTHVQARASLHVPLAGDLAAVNAAVLFSEEPRIVIPRAHEGATPDTTAVATESRLGFLLEQGLVYSHLIEAAETCAAMGGVYIYPAWDMSVAPTPFVTVAQVDQAVPTFRWGFLTSVIFWRDLRQDGNQILRHLECHEVVDGAATITHGLYSGAAGTLGEKRALISFPDTAVLQEVVTLPFADLDVHYIPNMRPNRLWRNSPLGISDYSGSEGLFDSLDETYAAWMRDIRLSKARVIVPQEYLNERGEFDIDNEVYAPLTMEPGAASQGTRSIEAVQFDIRVDDYLKTSIEFTERVVSNAGYSPQTFGLRIEGRAESGTALRIRENKTFLTQKRKGHWWRPAIGRCLEQLLLIDAAQFSTPGIDPNLDIDVELSDGVTNDPVELAQTVNVLKQAMAVSTETRVKMVHPEWTQDQVQAEVDRILEEEKKPEPPAVAVGGVGEVRTS